MKPLNLTRRAVNAVRKHIAKSHLAKNTDYMLYANHMLAVAEASQKFLLPHNGMLFEEGHKSTVEFFNLPSPCVCLEFSLEVPSEEEFFKKYPNRKREDLGINRIILACQTKPNDRIHIYTIDQRINGGWAHAPSIMEVYKEGTKYMCHHGFFPGSKLDGVPKEILDMEHYRSTIDANIVMSLVEILGCKNIETKKIGGSFTKNGIRITSGPLAQDEYHILIVKNKDGAVSSMDNEDNQTDDSLGIKPGNIKRSPREHFRRGHIRHLDSGNIWIQSTIVMAGTGGVITKDYKIPKRKKK